MLQSKSTKLVRTTIQIRRGDEDIFKKLQESGLNASKFYSDMLNQHLSEWFKSEAKRLNENMRKLLL